MSDTEYIENSNGEEDEYELIEEDDNKSEIENKNVKKRSVRLRKKKDIVKPVSKPEQEEVVEDEEEEEVVEKIKKVDGRSKYKGDNRTEKQKQAYLKMREGREKWLLESKKGKIDQIASKAETLIKNKARNKRNQEKTIDNVVEKVYKKTMTEEDEEIIARLIAKEKRLKEQRKHNNDNRRKKVVEPQVVVVDTPKSPQPVNYSNYF